MTATSSPALVWLRADLRLADNPALTAAVERGGPVVVAYVLDEASEGLRPPGGASRWWLHHALQRLGTALAERGQSLVLRRGRASDAIAALVRESGAGAVFWNRRYGAAERRIDGEIKATLRDAGVAAESFQANLLFEPWTISTAAGQPFRVFTPFWRACLGALPPRPPLPVPPDWPAAAPLPSDRLDGWRLLPTAPDWAGGLREHWQGGEAAADARLRHFIAQDLPRYAADRDRPDRDATSRLSPHLAFGEISPFQLWHAAGAAEGSAGARNVGKFLSELGWREFSWHLLFHFPELPTRNFQPRFDAFPWRQPGEELAAWQRGRTGVPIVDAGMRQLWNTGWMHNRVRMIVASFLVKNLLIDWRIGESWFWDTLVDADAANNAASWQWVAGSGADAAPYFRIFNPHLQAEKFDPDGAYVRCHVEELAALPAAALRDGRRLAADYRAPIVDLAASRERALSAFRSLRAEE